MHPHNDQRELEPDARVGRRRRAALITIAAILTLAGLFALHLLRAAS